MASLSISHINNVTTLSHSATDVAKFAAGTTLCISQTLTDGATINWNTALGQVATVTLGGTRTVAAPTNLIPNAFYSIEVLQDATGGRTLSWNSIFKWNAGAAPTLSTGANARDYFTFRSDGTNLYEQGRSQGVA